MNHPDLKMLASRINAALPQTQCTRCGFPDCASYAEAIAQAQAPINQCPPGGFEGVTRLAAITGQLALPLNPANGLEGPRSVAVIDEAWCIGCTLCLPICPTDAIVGGNKMMHTVIESACTGCELCVAVCPVDCIGLENVTDQQTGWNAWSQQEADAARSRYEFHASSYRNPAARGTRPAEPPREDMPRLTADEPQQPADKKRAAINAALAKARASRTTNGPNVPSPAAE